MPDFWKPHPVFETLCVADAPRRDRIPAFPQRLRFHFLDTNDCELHADMR